MYNAGQAFGHFQKLLLDYPTKNHKLLATLPDENGEKQYYRAYNCIENSVSYDVSTDKNVI